MSTLSVTTIKSKAASTPPVVQDSAGTEVGTFCRAWVNFNGTGTIAIRGSGNVSSITDGGAGIYTVNFTNAMPDANYCMTGMKNNIGSNIGSHLKISGTATTTSAAFESYENNVQVDCSTVCVAIFR